MQQTQKDFKSLGTNDIFKQMHPSQPFSILVFSNSLFRHFYDLLAAAVVEKYMDNVA
jgi:hypothetical protein